MGDMDGWCFPSLASGHRTLVLLGRTGNGKSATGNSILGRAAFESDLSLSGVTRTAERKSTTLTNGEIVNVIDTPGLFDFCVGSEFISKEFVKCIDLAKDGIHGVLLVLSIRGRFTEEEDATIKSLWTFFGPKITDYMIVVFTGGDYLRKKSVSIEDHLARSCPEPLKNILNLCKNRCVLFDNDTEDVKKQESQRRKLLTLVDKVIDENGGKPYTDNLFAEFREAALLQQQKQELLTSNDHTEQKLTELTDQAQKSYDEQLKRITEMVESKLQETSQMLQQQLAEEKAARLFAEKIFQDAKRESDDEIRKLRENLAEAEKIAQDAQRQSQDEIRKLKENLEKLKLEKRGPKPRSAPGPEERLGTCTIL